MTAISTPEYSSAAAIRPSSRSATRYSGNRGFAGIYAQALAVPGVDITQTRKDRFKEGLVVNLEQAISDDLGAFARFSYNDGRNEIMSFTDIDRSGLVGLSLKGTGWRRPDDTVGVAAVINALSSAHARFLEAGGVGILIGDGKLNYGTEDILEAYYRFQVVKALSLTADYQFIVNPAYNRDRGPVSVLGLRAHIEF